MLVDAGCTSCSTLSAMHCMPVDINHHTLQQSVFGLLCGCSCHAARAWRQAGLLFWGSWGLDTADM